MRSLKGQKGQGMTEYILITALVIIVIIGAFRIFRPKVEETMKDTGNAIQQQGSNAAKESHKGI